MRQFFINLWQDFLSSYKSFTIWLNGAALTVLSVAPMMQDTFPQMKEYLTADFYKLCMGGIVVLNLILRFKTSNSLRNKS